MPKTVREIAESLRVPIPEPRRVTRVVKSWRGLKPNDRLVEIADPAGRVWWVDEVNSSGATVRSMDGSFGLLADPEWRKTWKRAGRKKEEK